MALTNKKLIGARDPLGIRPLVLGELDGKPVLASETRALDMVGAEFVRDVEHGEIVVISQDGRRVDQAVPGRPARPCVFEYVYFAMPDSVVNGRSVYDVRKRMGARWPGERRRGRRGRAGARLRRAGRARLRPGRGMPFEMGIIRNHYVGRTFIQPTQDPRDSACG